MTLVLCHNELSDRGLLVWTLWGSRPFKVPPIHNAAISAVFLVLVPGCPGWWDAGNMHVDRFTVTTTETTDASGETFADEPTSSSSTSNDVPTTSPTLTEVTTDGMSDDSTNSSGKSTSVGAVCGDSIVDIDEECDDGNSDNTDECTNRCVFARCGDGIINADEECEIYDANCTSECELFYCGDGILHEGEQCDYGQLNSDTGNCTLKCRVAFCGDALVHQGIEECDRGANLNDTGCDDDCKLVHRIIFVTPATDGNLGGLIGADKFCQATAANAELKNAKSFMAWLHDGTTGPSDRFDTGFTGIYELPNGAIVTYDGWSGLTDGNIQTSINIQADKGSFKAEGNSVWTNTMPNGIDPINPEKHCNGWTDNTDNYLGCMGGSNWLDGRWTYNKTNFYCGTQRPIYCFEGKS